jgi:hypothetical protein
MVSLAKFIENYQSLLEAHDTRVKAVVEAKRIARGYAVACGGNFECNAQNINVLSMPGEKARYFTDDELILMTTKEN